MQRENGPRISCWSAPPSEMSQGRNCLMGGTDSLAGISERGDLTVQYCATEIGKTIEHITKLAYREKVACTKTIRQNQKNIRQTSDKHPTNIRKKSDTKTPVPAPVPTPVPVPAPNTSTKHQGPPLFQLVPN